MELKELNCVKLISIYYSRQNWNILNSDLCHEIKQKLSLFIQLIFKN